MFLLCNLLPKCLQWLQHHSVSFSQDLWHTFSIYRFKSIYILGVFGQIIILKIIINPLFCLYFSEFSFFFMFLSYIQQIPLNTKYLFPYFSYLYSLCSLLCFTSTLFLCLPGNLVLISEIIAVFLQFLSWIMLVPFHILLSTGRHFLLSKNIVFEFYFFCFMFFHR